MGNESNSKKKKGEIDWRALISILILTAGILAVAYRDTITKIFPPTIIKTLYPAFTLFILVLLAIPPVIWVISVSFLGRAIRKSKEEKTKTEIEKQTLLNRKLKEAEENCRKAKTEEAGECLEEIKLEKAKLSEETERINKKYNSLSVVGSVVIPSIWFMIALITIWLYPLYQEHLFVSLSLFGLVLLSIILGIRQMYKVMEVIEEVAQPAEEFFIASLKNVFEEIEKSKQPVLKLSFRDKQPTFKVTKSQEFIIKFAIHLSKGNVANNVMLMFHVPQGFDYPNRTKWQQPNDFALPNALSTAIQWQNILARISQIEQIQIKASDIIGEYTLGYSLNCENFGTVEKFKVIVEEPKLDIIKATYGFKGATIDVTARLKLLVKAGKLFIPAGPGESNKAAGKDPSPGGSKEWNIKYTVNGEEKIAKFKEDEKIELPQ